MKTILVDFQNVDEDGLVRSHLDRANAPLFMYDMVTAYDSHGAAFAGQVVAMYRTNDITMVKLAVDPALCVDQELIAAQGQLGAISGVPNWPYYYTQSEVGNGP